MDRVTKLIVVASTVLAVYLLAQITNRGIETTLSLALVAFAGSWIAMALAGDVVMSALLPAAYVIPALVYLAGGRFVAGHFTPWLAALLGAMMPHHLRSGWALRRPWKVPLVLWALSLALAWPIIALCEIDFTLALLGRYNLPSTRIGGPPPLAIAWTLNVTCITVIALLWLDWLVAVYSTDRVRRFESVVVWPAFGVSLFASSVAVYQGFGHMSFLNPTVFGKTGRASATMLDANVFGAIAAMWLPVVTSWAIEASPKNRRGAWVWTAVTVVCGIALWSSGSRTALLAALVGLTWLAGSEWRARSGKGAHALMAVAGVAVLVAGLVLFTPIATTGPIARIRLQLLPDLSPQTLNEAAHKLWDRGGYGTVAVKMIAEHPWVGVGVGRFNGQSVDEAYLLGDDRLPPDNAQNWYRHQLAELGLLGSIGWLGWIALFGWMLISRPPPDEKHARVAAVKGAIVGLAAASLLGMPTQDAAVSFTFVAFAFWCLALTATHEAPNATAPLGKLRWTLISALVSCFVAGTAYTAWTELRPPYRALRANWSYQYGFYSPEAGSPPFRWTEGKAVDVFPVTDQWLKLVIGAAAPDAAQRPVDVTVWRDHRRILRLKRRDDVAITRYVRVPEGHKRMMIQVEVSRTWRPADFNGGTDGRPLGVSVGTWTFVDSPPPGEVLIY